MFTYRQVFPVFRRTRCFTYLTVGSADSTQQEALLARRTDGCLVGCLLLLEDKPNSYLMPLLSLWGGQSSFRCGPSHLALHMHFGPPSYSRVRSVLVLSLVFPMCCPLTGQMPPVWCRLCTYCPSLFPTTTCPTLEVTLLLQLSLFYHLFSLSEPLSIPVTQLKPHHG